MKRADIFFSILGYVVLMGIVVVVSSAQANSDASDVLKTYYNRETVRVYKHTAYIPVGVIGLASDHQEAVDQTVTDFEADNPKWEVTGVAFETHQADFRVPVRVRDTLDYVVLTYRNCHKLCK